MDYVILGESVTLSTCIATISRGTSRYWRTEEQAISDFLSLPPDRMRVPMFHLHIYLRRSVKYKGRAFVTGIDVTS
eukprot:14621056-Ditylum_brightwellii.AAC.1